MDPTERISRLLRGMRQLVQWKSLAKPTAMVIEDLHWIDSSSEAYLNTIIDDLGGAPTLLVLTWRPTYRSPFNEHTYVSRLVLEPLVDADALALVRAALGIDNLPDELAQVIARKAEGNPFFLEEIGRALLETGAVSTEAGRLVLTRPASAIAVPDRVQDVIAARIDRLSEDQKRTVQTASVIGREFTLRLLQRVADAAERAERALVELKALEFVYEKVALEELEYVFKHAFTQDVAYESILHARRRDLHAKIGAAIEELYADRIEERVDELAYHFTRGEVWDRAARYARQAGDRAAALCADAKAVEFYERSLDALGRLPPIAETARLGIDVRLALRAPLWRSGQLDRLFEIFKDAEALATRHGETERLDVAYSFFVQYHWAKGEQEEAIAYGNRCLEVARAREDLGLAVTSHYYMGSARFHLGQYGKALEHFHTIIDSLEGARATERFGLSGLPYCGACALGALALMSLGDTAGAYALLERGEWVASAANHLYTKVPLAVSRGRLLAQDGKLEEAIAVLEPAAAVCREKKFAGQLMLVLAALAAARARVGRTTDGIAAAREGIELQEKAGAFVGRGEFVRVLAEAYLHAGELDSAETTARESLAFAERLKERGTQGLTAWVLAEVARRRGDHDSARQYVETARAIADELGMRPLAARCQETSRSLG